MRKLFQILFLVFCFYSAAKAQDGVTAISDTITPADEAIVETIEGTSFDDLQDKPDTSLYLNELFVSPDSVGSWRKRKEFSYINSIDSLLKARASKKMNEPADAGGRGFVNRLLNSSALQIFFWTAGITFVLFIIYRLFLAEGVFQRRSKSKKEDGPVIKEELIDGESDFNALIQQALQTKNYRQAVRYQYLRTLHLLADKKIIELSPDKTNYQYVHEISNHNYRHDFASLTLNYEYVWYGGFAIDQTVYQKIEPGFINLNKKIDN